ncbi:invasion protein IalB [Labrys monachus]|uniref:Invasion protein IalB n=2 Tax=Labrys monachus TaxID=217067 RepID=A0ABU0FLH5_9HYPH|nr:invasion protein IalB [Labrys monachus]
MRRLAGIAVGIALAGMAGIGSGGAATAPAKKPAPKPAAEAQHKADDAAAAPAAAPRPANAPGWAARCSAAARQGPLECAVEESAVMNGTGQLVVGITIRVPSDTRSPVMLVHLPLGLYLPAGVKLQVDAAEPVGLALQTCDASGCFAGAPVTAGLLDQLKHGQQLKVIFQNLQHADIAVPLPLGDFAASFAKIQ